jgi:hypothetical protein
MKTYMEFNSENEKLKILDFKKNLFDINKNKPYRKQYDRNRGLKFYENFENIHHTDDEYDPFGEETNMDDVNPYRMEVGNRYKIDRPVYDDYDEGLGPDIEIVEVLSIDEDGYQLKNIEFNFEYHLYFHMMEDYIIEKVD